MTRRRRRNSLVRSLALALLATTAHAAPFDPPWPVDVRRRINAVAADGPVAYLATGDNRAELVVVDVETGARLGTFDAAGGADALGVRVLEPGIVKLGRRQSDAPEVYRLDVSDPAAIRVLDAQHRARHVRWKPDAIPPVIFRDANGDGVYRLACLGDSNTSLVHGVAKWCEMLAERVRGLEVVNVAVSGATVVTPNLRWESDATQQMAAALSLDVDAVLLAFGTNDRMQGRTTDEVIEAYLEQAEVAAFAGVTFYAAATPPMGGCMGAGCSWIVATNLLLHLAFPGSVVDFFTGVTDQHFRVPDRIHHNAAGQELRAERTAAMIASPLAQSNEGPPPADRRRAGASGRLESRVADGQ